MSSSSREAERVHFVIVPVMAQGHMIPMADLGLLLASRGALVSLVTTPSNAERLQPSIDRARASHLPIRLVPLPFSNPDVPPGCDNLDAVPDGATARAFLHGLPVLENPLRLFLQHRAPLPTCIIADFCLPWTRRVARDLAIRRYVFYSVCCFTLTCHHLLDRLYEGGGVARSDSEKFEVPGLEHHRIFVTKAQAPGFFADEYLKGLKSEIAEADVTADGIIVNTFEEMEPMYVKSFARAMGRKVWMVGPVSLFHDGGGTSGRSRGKRAAVAEEDVVSWLDGKAAKSVVYLCLGSLTNTGAEQLREIGMGLEASGSPFIWVLRGHQPEVETWLAEGFEERNRGRALVVRGWAPQVVALNHPSVGGFVTHCGWNSSMEGIAAGVPMVTWPHFADQFLNERMLVDVVGTAVAIGVEEPKMYWNAGKVGVVGRERVEAAVRMVMGRGEDAEERRRKAKKLGAKAREAMAEGGSSDGNLTLLMAEVSRLAGGMELSDEGQA